MRPALAVLVLSSLSAAACSETPAGAGSAKVSATATAPKATTAPAPTPVPTISAKPREDCPKDSAGPGTITQPCLGKGNTRLMEAKWAGKSDDKGPLFKLQNKSGKVILYGKIAVFFYDKAGKQLEVKEGDKTAPFKTCAGNIFAGIMKGDEKATMSFSCVPKSDLPEGTAHIEGELVTVGFADSSEKKTEFYWSNPDLAPNARAKGGVK